MSIDADYLLKRNTKAESNKASWDTIYRDVFEFTMPDRNGFITPESNPKDYRSTRQHQFDSTGETAADEFVSTMQEFLCPPYADWIEFEAGEIFNDREKDKINKQLDILATKANGYKNLSNFDVAFSEFCYDLVAGTACMLIQKGSLKSPLSFRAIPLNEYCIEEGKDGEVRGVFRTFQMPKDLVRYQWVELQNKPETVEMPKEGTEKAAEKVAETTEIVECMYKDYSTNLYGYYVIDKKQKKILVERYSKTAPFVVLRWNKAAGEPYGRGVGLKALNDIRSLNKIMEYSLRAFAFNCPPLLVQEDAVLDIEQFELLPFSLNVVPDVQNSVAPLQMNINHNIESYKVNDMRTIIKQNMFGNTLPPDNQNASRTAYEVQQRMSMLRRNLSSVFGRLIGEFLMPTVRRIFEVLLELKEISSEVDIDDINNIVFKIKINTQLTKQLKSSEALSIIQSIGTFLQVDQTGQVMRQVLKFDELAIYLLDIMGIPATFINPIEAVRQIAQQQAQAQAQAMQAQSQADVQNANAKEMGKAQAQAALEQSKRW